jgi:hypothetical protein
MKKNLEERNSILKEKMSQIDIKIKELDIKLNSETVTSSNWKSLEKIVKSIHDLCDEHDVLRWEFEKNERELYYL